MSRRRRVSTRPTPLPIATVNAPRPQTRLPAGRPPPPPVLAPPLGIAPTEPEEVAEPECVIEPDGEADAEAEGEGEGELERLGDGDGLGEPDAGQVWVRLKKSAVPVISAAAPAKVQPAGVTIHAFDVSGPPLAKLPASVAAVMVTLPLAPKSAVTDTKSPLVSCCPGKTKTQMSLPCNGPPPWFASQL